MVLFRCLSLLLFFFFFSCKMENLPNSNNYKAKLNFTLKLDEVQQRLNSFGLPADIPVGHAVQTPNFKSMSIHYIELAPNAFTPLGEGVILFKGQETDKGGENAVDFDKAILGFVSSEIVCGAIATSKLPLSIFSSSIGFETNFNPFSVFFKLRVRGIVIALRHGLVGTTWAYFQLLIQPRNIRRPSFEGIFDHVTPA